MFSDNILKYTFKTQIDAIFDIFIFYILESTSNIRCLEFLETNIDAKII